jgi:hypothetical protein
MVFLPDRECMHLFIAGCPKSLCPVLAVSWRFQVMLDPYQNLMYRLIIILFYSILFYCCNAMLCSSIQLKAPHTHTTNSTSATQTHEWCHTAWKHAINIQGPTPRDARIQENATSLSDGIQISKISHSFNETSRQARAA